jgi:hypothetical protein
MVLTGILWLPTVGRVQAFGRHGGYAAYSYYPVLTPVLYYTPVYLAAPAVCAVPSPVTAPVYATPRPAPPSSPSTGEPPLGSALKRAPTFNESRSGSKYPPMDDRCQVGFWNISGRDLTLKVNGQSRLLLRNRALTLELGRDFVWQIDSREPQRQQVPADQASFEVILRQ